MTKRWRPRGLSVSVVPRAACAFDRVALAHPGRKGLAAARLAVRQRSRFGPACRAFLSPDTDGAAAAAWTWQADDPEALMVPETVLQARGEDGMRLVACAHGFDGQAWVDGALKASRWWPQRPDAAAWSTFVASLPIKADDAPPAPETVATRPPPVVPRDPENLSALTAPRRVALASALIGAFALAFQTGGWFVTSAAIMQENRALDVAAEDVRATEQARRMAVSLSERAHAAAGGADATAAVQAVLAVLAALPPDAITVRQVSLSAGRIEVAAYDRTGGADQPRLVTVLEGSPALSRVAVVPDGRQGGFTIGADIVAFGATGAGP